MFRFRYKNPPKPEQFYTTQSQSCGTCGNVVDDGCDAYECCRCATWTHAGCVDKQKRPSQTLKKLLSGNKYFPFLCRPCQSNSSRGAGVPTQVQFDAVLAELSSVKDQLAALQRDNADLRQQNESLRSELQSLKDGGAGGFHHQLVSTIGDTVRDCFEKQHKVKNCVVVGLQEDRDEDLRASVKKMVEHAGVSPEDIKDVFRDGQKRPDRPRIVKVRFARRSAKMTFLRHSRKYRELGPKFERCFVRHDMTYNERCHDRQLRDQLKAMPDGEREQFMIRDFQIVGRRFARPLNDE